MTQPVVESPLVFLTDRSAVEADDTCGMKFWLNRKEGGIGIVPKDEPLALMVGREVHNDLQTIGNWPNEMLEPANVQREVDQILAGLTVEDRMDTKRMEILFRRLGWMVAFALYIEPRIREKYDNVAIESEIVLDRDPLWVASTPDRVLRRKADGVLEYREYKSTISASNKWMNSWPYAIQLHIGIAAAQEELKERVHFAQVMGMMKGGASYTDDHMVHPYVWGYYNRTSNVWAHEYKDARSAQWEPMPVWEYPHGLVKWVMAAGPEIAQTQFPMSVPVFLNVRMLDEWVLRRKHREALVRSVEKACVTNLDLRSIYFEKRTKNCRPAWGDPCPYLPVCWNAETSAFPLAKGDFIPRIPHHELEILCKKEGIA